MAFFISLEGEHPLPDMDGGGLARAWDTLEPFCESLGVASLMDFFSMSEAEQRHWEVEEAQLFPEQWFAATDGLATVRALLAHLAAHPIEGVKESALTDLENFEAALSWAEREQVRWHLSIDD